MHKSYLLSSLGNLMHGPLSFLTCQIYNSEIIGLPEQIDKVFERVTEKIQVGSCERFLWFRERTVGPCHSLFCFLQWPKAMESLDHELKSSKLLVPEVFCYNDKNLTKMGFLS